MPMPSIEVRPEPFFDQLGRFPWWLVAIVAFIAFFGLTIALDSDYKQAFLFIIRGIGITIMISIGSYLVALLLGLFAGMMRVSNSVILNNLATLYVELVRGVPMLVLIFFIAFVGVKGVIDLIHNFGVVLDGIGLANPLVQLQNEDIPMSIRAVIALAVTYGAFLAEIFRAGIQSIGRGQMEAARSLGMSYPQAMRYVILPQAIRNVLPALGNDFIAMLKDSSLVSVLAVRDVTQIARLYAGRTFRFPESYTTLVIVYLSMTLVLSLLLRLLERRMRTHA